MEAQKKKSEVNIKSSLHTSIYMFLLPIYWNLFMEGIIKHEN